MWGLGMRRRDILTGAAALSAYGALGAPADACNPRIWSCRALLSTANAKTFLLNYNPAFVTKIHAAVAAARAGSRRPIFVFAGDSTTLGFGANASNSWLGAAQSSAVAVVSSLLSAAGVPSQNNSIFGNSGASGPTLTQFLQRDSRLSGFTGWNVSTAGASLPGGQFIIKSTADANAGTFAPGVTTDTALITWASNTTSGTFTVDVGGSVLATIATAAASGLHQQSVSLPRAVNALNIKCTVAGSGVFLMGIEMYDSVAPPQISLLNWGGEARSRPTLRICQPRTRQELVLRVQCFLKMRHS
jgi:hypothetical protein